MKSFKLFLVLFSLLGVLHSYGQDHSVARQWNEVLLEAIRNDFARPTVHARNLFHISSAMYDSWASYDNTAKPFLFNRNVKGYVNETDFTNVPKTNLVSDRNEAISYAAYRLILHRFSFSPGKLETEDAANALMAQLGYDTNHTSVDFSDGSAASLGNYIAQVYIEFGLIDGANEEQDYINLHYRPVNPPLVPIDPGNPLIIDLNRWQPMFFDEFIDQSGNSIPAGVVDFLSPEWGQVIPFSLSATDRTIYSREDNEYWVYHDPGAPPYLDSENEITSEQYKWGFSLVSIWGAHLGDETLIDISPGNFGNTSNYPESFEEYDTFYNYIEGGDVSTGHDINPHTNAPYAPNMVPFGDYSRVLAEFWADGPDSETPPGHWFTILNYVIDHPLFERKFEGQGNELDELEFDIKAFFILGGAMHDCAISAWGIKGWYDYIRPISAIRAMADLGQSTDNTKSNYNENGIPLVDGYIETVEAGDALAGNGDENIGKIKLFTWRGHDYIQDPETDVAGVGWILAENWWPYQRPTFVTPPFAGYVSGHSTYSRAAAEVLTLLTGDPFFPGGIGEFEALQNEFLVFEDGPSVDITLQWATYRDASEQTSLSRIWGGIHPPADDIPGRLIGEKIGIEAFAYAKNFFQGNLPLHTPDKGTIGIYPNPISSGGLITIENKEYDKLTIYNIYGNTVFETNLNKGKNQVQLLNMEQGLYIYELKGQSAKLGRLLVK